jgi:hypothetical protein
MEPICNRTYPKSFILKDFFILNKYTFYFLVLFILIINLLSFNYTYPNLKYLAYF